MSQQNDFRDMTASTVGRDLLQAFVQEFKLLPDVWVKLSKTKQDDVIDRLRARIERNIKMAVHLLASQGRTVVAGDLDQITIKDGVKAIIKFSAAAPSLHQLYDSQNKAVLVIVANPDDHTAGMDEVQGESDQRSMDLGREYQDNDGGGMDGVVVDCEFKEIPALPEPSGFPKPTEEELDQAFEDGYQAAADGKPESNCPVMAGDACIAWVKGWKCWHEENPTDEAVAA